MAKIINNTHIECSKCEGRMLVDRVFSSYDHLELYCLVCGKREMYNHPDRHGEVAQWIMKAEKTRARITGSNL
jgi:hypothetical protein